MKLREINKQRYGKHYKIVFAVIVIELLVVSIVCSSLLISWFGTPGGSHFLLNIIGVVFAALAASFALYQFREHPFMEEVVYVWNLKKQLNQIHRKQHKIEPAIETNNRDAMIIMNYLYQGSKQLYELDDNTITLDNLMIKSRLLDDRIAEQNIQLSTEDYHPDLLRQF